MADYRDMAAALSGGYGQDTGPITADTLITLKNGKTASASDLLGMLKGFGQSVGSNLESLGRGGLSTFLGGPVDTANIALSVFPMEVPDKYGNINYTPETELRGGSRDILGMMPRMTAPRRETAGMEELGGYMTPATAKVLKPAATGVVRMAGQEINAGLTGQPTRSLLGDITLKPKLLDVYHGTPHTLPPTERNPLGEFDASKIGTGEGAHAYGYGIYTAENPVVAGSYTRTLQGSAATKPDWSYLEIGGKSLDNQTAGMPPSVVGYVAKALKDANGDVNKAIKQFSLDSIGDETNPVVKDVLSVLNKGKDSKVDLNAIPSGNLYKVDLPDEKIAAMLDFDKPMAEQRNLIEKMRKALVGNDSPLSRVRQFEINDFLNDNVRLRNLRPQSIVNLNDPQIVKRLSEAGIPGIKYLDQFSREAGQGTRNFVTFPGSEKSMTILERNAEKITK